MTSTFQLRHIGRPAPSRSIVTGHRDVFTGEYPSGKEAMGFRMVQYEGLPQRDMIVLLVNDPDVRAFEEEAAHFMWTDEEGCPRRYYPDLAVDLLDGRRICIECKPRKKVIKHRLEDVYRLVKVGALDAGYDDFELWTDDLIQAEPRLANAELINSERTFVVDESHMHTMRVTLDRLGGTATVRRLRCASSLGAFAYRSVVKLVARREIVPATLGSPLDDNMIVSIPRK